MMYTSAFTFIVCPPHHPRSVPHDPLQKCPRLLSRPAASALAGRECRRQNRAARHGPPYPSELFRLADHRCHLFQGRRQRSVSLFSDHSSAHALSAAQAEDLGRTHGAAHHLRGILALCLRLYFRGHGRNPVLGRICKPLQFHCRGLSHLHHGSHEEHCGILPSHSSALRRGRQRRAPFRTASAAFLEASSLRLPAFAETSGRVLHHDLRRVSVLPP